MCWRAAAAKFSAEIETLLGELAMSRTKFEIRFNASELPPDAWTERGIDQAEFFLSANVGEEVRPLARIVGELGSNRDLGDAVPRDVQRRAIDHLVEPCREDMAAPFASGRSRILEPKQIRQPARQRDEIRFPVPIQICRNHLVAALQVCGKSVLCPFQFGSAGRRDSKQDRRQALHRDGRVSTSIPSRIPYVGPSCL